ncbi:MAG: hypothetical protein WCJ64_11820 [Rhodospirillaceae bacterium]
MLSINFASVIEPVARKLLGEPNPHHSTKSEWRYGSNGSLSVVVSGPKAGRWHDHEAGEGGGVLDLIARHTGLKNGAGIEWLRTEIGIDTDQPQPARKPRADADEAVRHAEAAEKTKRVGGTGRRGPRHPEAFQPES